MKHSELRHQPRHVNPRIQVTRVSLKERLENMKQKVAGADKHEKVKEKEAVR